MQRLLLLPIMAALLSLPLSGAEIIDYSAMFEKLRNESNYVVVDVGQSRIDGLVEVKLIDGLKYANGVELFELLGYKVTTLSGKIKVSFDDDSYLLKAIDGRFINIASVMDVMNLPLTMNQNFGSIKVAKTGRTPYELNGRRELERNIIGNKALDDFLSIEADYASFGNANYDIRLNSGYDTSSEEGSYSGSLFMTQDFMYHQAEVGLSKNSFDDVKGRINISRRLDNSIVGFYEFGDVSIQGDNFVTSPMLGAGFAMQKKSGWRNTSTIGDRTINGFGSSGNTVELYKNGQIIAWEIIDTSGYYSFENINLTFGSNNYKIREYGAYGEERTKDVSYYMSSESLLRGDYDWNFYYVDQDTFLSSSLDSNQESYFSSNMGYGVTDSVEAYVGVNSYAESGRNFWSSISYLGSAFNTSLRLATDDESTSAVNWEARTGFWGMNFGSEASFFQEGFSSPMNAGRSLQHRARIYWTGGFQSLGLRGTSFAISYRDIAYYEGRAEQAATFRLSQANKWLLSSYELKHRSSGDPSSRVILTGTKYLSGISLTFEQEHSADASSSWSARYSKIFDKSRFNATVSGGGQGTNISMGYGYKFDEFELSANAGLSQDGDANFGLSIRYNAFLDRRNGQWRYDRKSLRGGTAYVRVFIDNNNNGFYDNADKPLPGIKFKADNSVKIFKSDKKGWLIVKDIPTKYEAILRVDTGSLPDAYMKPVKNGVAVKIHRGGEVFVDFPVRQMTDLLGDLECLDIEECNVEGIEVVATKLDTGEVFTTKVTFDRKYEFNHLPSGPYRLELNPDHLDYSSLDIEAPVFVTMFGSERGAVARTIYLMSVD